MIFKSAHVMLAAGTLLVLGACNKRPVIPTRRNPAPQNRRLLRIRSRALNRRRHRSSESKRHHGRQSGWIDEDAARGQNGWTCMPDNPHTPGHDPMCMDANAVKWAAAWIRHKPPPAETSG